MGKTTGVRLVLALLVLGWAAGGAPARADDPARESTEQERDKLDKEVHELSAKAYRMYGDGQYAAATELVKKVLAIRRLLYPPDKYPDGHPALATSLNNLGEMLQAQDEYGKAEPYLREALEMCKKLYPPDKYPDGRSDLASSLNNLGVVLQARGKYGKAEPLGVPLDFGGTGW